ncbi:proline-rich protein 2-like [Panthera pardus]|uniref:Proline-rich protein 2-like n=1 Tax=Panthera pardus TaxID=9691 RepID=A0A9W2UWY5_PANPR|nr:proline-rich protein 2-like [Panthera pardus]
MTPSPYSSPISVPATTVPMPRHPTCTPLLSGVQTTVPAPAPQQLEAMGDTETSKEEGPTLLEGTMRQRRGKCPDGLQMGDRKPSPGVRPGDAAPGQVHTVLAGHTEAGAGPQLLGRQWGPPYQDSGASLTWTVGTPYLDRGAPYLDSDPPHLDSGPPYPDSEPPTQTVGPLTRTVTFPYPDSGPPYPDSGVPPTQTIVGPPTQTMGPPTQTMGPPTWTAGPPRDFPNPGHGQLTPGLPTSPEHPNPPLALVAKVVTLIPRGSAPYLSGTRWNDTLSRRPVLPPKSQWPVWWVKLRAAGRAVGPPVSQTSRVAPSRHPRSFATWCGRSPVSSSGLDSRGPGPGTGEDVMAPQPTACQTPAAGPPSGPEADRKRTRGPIKAGRTSQLSPAPGASPRNPELSVGAQTETPGYGLR